jgi:hypothetical protein
MSSSRRVERGRHSPRCRGRSCRGRLVARVDKAAVRNTKDVDLLILRSDFPSVIEVLQTVGFVHQNVAGVDMFLDGPEESVRCAVHIFFASEKVHPDYLAPTPDVTVSEAGPDFPVPPLDALVRMELRSFRLKERERETS